MLISGNSSVGRARPCQGRGREFESRFPLQILESSNRKIWAFLLLQIKDLGAIISCRLVQGLLACHVSRLLY